ncbi:hypothetical protein [Corynebacterium sp. HMSC074A01]|uniref:hypothetical protein n=1 Tax=Corynebacterium sp. HMSC074A01 TaxID=1715030 RepID=UPI0008A317FE|nr:hypothetical protein [Corynebacterium sp. HMSC074A01]OHF36708.1 hypothetical protein HMPREF2550_06585 [Corynebacterium sp. HMSC074A01]
MTIILTAAAYVKDELRNEFGLVPPCFLPIGNRPLIHWQRQLLESARKGERTIVSLPEEFELTDLHLKYIGSAEIVRVPSSLSLVESLLYVINVSNSYDDEITVIHGDTLVDHLPDKSDFLGVAESLDGYDWDEQSTKDSGAQEVWCGVFSFKDGSQLVRSLAIAGSNFRQAVENYFQIRKLTIHHFDSWWDCGHLNTYLRAKTKITTQRSFNSLIIDAGYVTKSSADLTKMRREACWYDSLPLDAKPYTPALYEFDEMNGIYRLEYLPFPSLADTFVFGYQDKAHWLRILNFYRDWFKLSTSLANRAQMEVILRRRNELIVKKTAQRLEAMKEGLQIDIDSPLVINGSTLPPLAKIAEHLVEEALAKPVVPGILHGDLCFSNTLLDYRNSRIRILDPRGADSAEELIGDITYDVSKVLHSAIGYYDLILAGAFSIKYDHLSLTYDLDLAIGSAHQAVKDQFFGYQLLPRFKSVAHDAIPTMILLFLTMPPLHQDNPYRQAALLANGLRLYDEYYESNSNGGLQ